MKALFKSKLIEESRQFTDGKRWAFTLLFNDLCNRATLEWEENEDYDIGEAVEMAIDSGLIFNDDLWEVYRAYCKQGENPEIAYALLEIDIHTTLMSAILKYPELVERKEVE